MTSARDGHVQKIETRKKITNLQSDTMYQQHHQTFRKTDYINDELEFNQTF